MSGKPTCTMHDERYRNAPLVGRGHTLCTCRPITVTATPATQPAMPPTKRRDETDDLDLAGFVIDEQPGCPGALVHACGWEIEVGAYCHDPIPLLDIIARAQQHMRDGCKHHEDCECVECGPVVVPHALDCGCVTCEHDW